jgi:hypothetical protein
MKMPVKKMTVDFGCHSVPVTGSTLAITLDSAGGNLFCFIQLA